MSALDLVPILGQTVPGMSLLFPQRQNPFQAGDRQCLDPGGISISSFPNLMARRSLVENSLPQPNSSSRMGVSGSVPLFPNLQALQDDGIHGMDATGIALSCAAHRTGGKDFWRWRGGNVPVLVGWQCGITSQGRELYPNPRHPGVGGITADPGHNSLLSQLDDTDPQTVSFPLWRLSFLLSQPWMGIPWEAGGGSALLQGDSGSRFLRRSRQGCKFPLPILRPILGGY